MSVGSAFDHATRQRIGRAAAAARLRARAAHGTGPQYAYDRVKQALHLHTDRGSALREAVMAVRNAFR